MKIVWLGISSRIIMDLYFQFEIKFWKESGNISCMVVQVYEASDLKWKQTINFKNAEFLKKGFAKGPVICSTVCPNSSFL